MEVRELVKSMLRKERAERGWSQVVAAREVGCSPSSISTWEKPGSTLDFRNAQRYFAAFGIDEFEMIRRIGKEMSDRRHDYPSPDSVHRPKLVGEAGPGAHSDKRREADEQRMDELMSRMQWDLDELRRLIGPRRE